MIYGVSLTGAGDADSDVNDNMCLSDLLDVNVVLRSDCMPAIRSFVAQTGTPAEEYSPCLHGIMTAEDGGVRPNNLPDEVTLPLREVLHLVSLVSSVEEQVNNTEEDEVTAGSSTTLQEDNQSSPTDSLPSTITSLDPRETVPLLKDIFYHPHPGSRSSFCNGIKLKPRVRQLSQKEEDEIDDVLSEVFDSSTDAEEEEEDEEDSETEGEDDSHMEDEEEEDEVMLKEASTGLQDVEAANYCKRSSLGCAHKR